MKICSSALGNSTDPYPGINKAVEDIGQDVDEDKKCGGHQYRTHHYGKVQLFQGVDGNFSYTLPSKNLFYKKSPGQQFCKPARDGGNHGVQRIA